MKITNKKIFAIIGIFVLLFIIGYWLFPGDEEDAGYIFDKSYNISLEDVKKSRTPLRLEDRDQNIDLSKSDADFTNGENTAHSGIDLKEIFSEGLINAHTTYKYFKHLEHKFRKSTTPGEHFDLVEKYLFSQFSENEARELFDTYKKYLQCEMNLLTEFRNLTSVKSMEEALETLKRIQDFRRDRLGVELADKLFGADVKAKEYAFRRADVVGNDILYGREKEELLEKLNMDMWGTEAEAVDDFETDSPNAWQRFHEKQRIYKKDIDELGSEAAKEARIMEYRTEFFSPDAVKRLEEVDKQIVQEKQTETFYREKEQEILSNKTISDEDKEEQLHEMQNEMFGEEADAFRRRETMRIELEKMMKENEAKKKKN